MLIKLLVIFGFIVGCGQGKEKIIEYETRLPPDGSGGSGGGGNANTPFVFSDVNKVIVKSCGCHASFGSLSENEVLDPVLDICGYIANKSMPKGGALDTTTYSKIVEWCDNNQ
jgi:hypothetical protein